MVSTNHDLLDRRDAGVGVDPAEQRTQRLESDLRVRILDDDAAQRDEDVRTQRLVLVCLAGQGVDGMPSYPAALVRPARRGTPAPVVALSQVNRAGAEREDKPPKMSNLRESGDIEADADVIVLLHHRDAPNRERERAREIDLIIDRNHNGPAGVTVTRSFLSHLARTGDLARWPRSVRRPVEPSLVGHLFGM